MLTDQWRCPCTWSNSFLRKHCRNCGEAQMENEVLEPALSVIGRVDARARTYIASKAPHGHRWKRLRAQGARLTSTWIDECGPGETKDFSELYERCIREAAEADVLILYREDGEILKGALIEAGAALLAGVPVHAVGCEDFNFSMHPLMTNHADLASALIAAGTMPAMFDWRQLA